MTSRSTTLRLTLRTASTWCCLALVPFSVSAQSGMSRDEAAQLYSAAGFPISNGQPVNRCGKPAKPRVTFVDINGDKRPEALFVDEDARCYAPSGRYFAVLTKEGANWRSIINGTGSIQAQSTRTAGWLDMRVTDSDCARDHRYDGRRYAGATGVHRRGDRRRTTTGSTRGAAGVPRSPPLRSPLRAPRLPPRRSRPPTRQRHSRPPASRSAAAHGEAAATIRARHPTRQAASKKWPTSTATGCPRPY